ncbi:unnamed protein product [Owenia fusiformis]|uniref:Uncharacterized protein n=1 Tax=Owenia fusiformis TaxID=6347 RepID=A0A8J1Y8T8_OWEFU|nr:unnamed protein product [Owenia fusiformis]
MVVSLKRTKMATKGKKGKDFNLAETVFGDKLKEQIMRLKARRLARKLKEKEVELQKEIGTAPVISLGMERPNQQAQTERTGMEVKTSVEHMTNSTCQTKAVTVLPLRKPVTKGSQTAVTSMTHSACQTLKKPALITTTSETQTAVAPMTNSACQTKAVTVLPLRKPVTKGSQTAMTSMTHSACQTLEKPAVISTTRITQTAVAHITPSASKTKEQAKSKTELSKLSSKPPTTKGEGSGIKLVVTKETLADVIARMWPTGEK